MSSTPHPLGVGGGGTETADICPYATSTSSQQQRLNNFNVSGGRCSTLGRLKNLEMTEYQKQKLLNEANTVRIKVTKYLHT